MRSLVRAVSIVVTLTLGAPALGSDTSDTVTEKKSDLRKSARDLKPGEKTASDRAEDAKDSARSGAAQARKKARHGKKKAHKAASDATR